jgi:ribosomal-protein-alanine N-acetyltransferase
MVNEISSDKFLLWKQTIAIINSIMLNWQKYHFGVWAIVDKKHQNLIGHCGFKFLENTTEVQIGYLLKKSYWGKGLATEAASAALKYGFEIAHLEKVVAVAKPDNIASRRVMEKLGMNYEKDAYFYKNHVVYYSMTRSQFAQLSQKTIFPLSCVVDACTLELAKPLSLACPLG